MRITKKVKVILLSVIMSLSTVNCLAEAGTLENTVQDDMSQENIGTVSWAIDNKNCYENMEKAYSGGYVPKVEKGYATIVLPLKSQGKIKGNVLRASLNLGEAATGPFVYKNYEKNVALTRNFVNGSKNTVSSYLVMFRLELKKDRYNGSYPVVVHVAASDNYGNPVEQDFTIYVNITDGKKTVEEVSEAAEEKPTFEPKIMVHTYTFSKKTITSGDIVKMDVVLLNTNSSESIRNMAVTLNTESEYIQLRSKSDSIYVDSIKAGGTYQVSYRFKVKKGTPQGQYDLGISMNYADSKGGIYSSEGKIKVDIVQSSKIQFDPLSIAEQAELGDTIEAQVNAMNLGRSKVYNVRAELKADGLTPKGTIFIGDIEAGEMGTGSVEILVGGLTNSSESFGITDGIVTFYYETEEGKEYKEEEKFNVNITAPFMNPSTMSEEDAPTQWWVIIAVITGILCIFIGYGIFRVVKRKRGGKNEMVA